MRFVEICSVRIEEVGKTLFWCVVITAWAELVVHLASFCGKVPTFNAARRGRSESSEFIS